MHPTQSRPPQDTDPGLTPSRDAIDAARTRLAALASRDRDAYLVHLLATILDGLSTEAPSDYAQGLITHASAYTLARAELAAADLAGFIYAREPEPDPFTTNVPALPSGVSGFALGRYAR